MKSRDAILSRIRERLANDSHVDPPPVPEVWPPTHATTEQLAGQFAEQLQAVQGEVHHVSSMDQARQKLAEMIKESGWKTLGAVDRPICRELTAGLAADRLAWVTPDWDPNRMAELPAGLVAAECLLADTGSCMVASGTRQERLICYLPPACLVVARTDQLVEHMPAAWDRVARQTAEPDRRGEFVFITGPSRTADIEKILILGVHGPKRLIVLLVD